MKQNFGLDGSSTDFTIGDGLKWFKSTKSALFSLRKKA